MTLPGPSASNYGINLKKEINVFSGVSYVVGMVIGSGIFITPKLILERVGSLGLSLSVWLLGATVAVAGGLCYIELGAVVKRSGGEYAYIHEAYKFGKYNLKIFASLLAFLFTWSSIFIIRSSSIAIVTMTFSRYLLLLFGYDVDNNIVVLKFVALVALVILTVINCCSTRLAAKIMSILSITKLAALFLIISIGMMVLVQEDLPLSFQHPLQPIKGFEPSVSSMALALDSVMYSYNGWNVLNYAIEETKNAERTLPLSLFIGIALVVISYLLVNVSYFAVLPYEAILNTEAVAISFGEMTLGHVGELVIPGLVVISTFGAANAGILCGSRIVFAAARGGMLPGVFSKIHNTFKTPIPALLLQVSIAMILISFSSVGTLVEGFAFTAFLFYGLSFLALIIMRFTHRRIPRPFKAWFILPVAVYAISVSMLLISLSLIHHPSLSISALVFISSGTPVYFLLVMESPCKIRPRLCDRINAKINQLVNLIFNLNQ